MFQNIQHTSQIIVQTFLLGDPKETLFLKHTFLAKLSKTSETLTSNVLGPKFRILRPKTIRLKLQNKSNTQSIHQSLMKREVKWSIYTIT